jgi:hypothetical protein
MEFVMNKKKLALVKQVGGILIVVNRYVRKIVLVMDIVGMEFVIAK